MCFGDSLGNPHELGLDFNADGIKTYRHGQACDDADAASPFQEAAASGQVGRFDRYQSAIHELKVTGDECRNRRSRFVFQIGKSLLGVRYQAADLRWDRGV
jgi:hypothetical protein